MPSITLSDIGEDMYSKEDVDRLVEAAEFVRTWSEEGGLWGYSGRLESALTPFRQQQSKKVVNVPPGWSPIDLMAIWKTMDALENQNNKRIAEIQYRLDSLAAKVK